MYAAVIIHPFRLSGPIYYWKERMECTSGVNRMTQCSWKILLLEPLSQRWWQKLAAVVSIEGERRQLYRTTSVIFPNSTVHPNLLSLTSNTGRMKFRKQWQSVHVCCFGHERCCMTVAWTPRTASLSWQPVGILQQMLCGIDLADCESLANWCQRFDVC